MKIPILTHEGKKFMPHMYPLDLGPGVDITLLRALHGLDGLLSDMLRHSGTNCRRGSGSRCTKTSIKESSCWPLRSRCRISRFFSNTRSVNKSGSVWKRRA